MTVSFFELEIPFSWVVKSQALEADNPKRCGSKAGWIPLSRHHQIIIPISFLLTLSSNLLITLLVN